RVLFRSNLVFKIEAAEPAISKMQFDLLAQSALGAKAIAVAHDEHPQHQFGINRGAAKLAVEGFQLVTKLSQNSGHHRIDPAQQMARRDALFQIEQIEKLALVPRLPTHHHPTPSPNAKSTESRFASCH